VLHNLTVERVSSVDWCVDLMIMKEAHAMPAHTVVSMYAISFHNAFAGAAAGASADMIVYGLDSYKVMRQTGGKLKFSRIFRGMIASALTGAAPSFGLFFACYSPTKRAMEDMMMRYSDDAKISPIPPIVASLVGGIPASVALVPADTVKKEMLLGTGAHTSSFLSTCVHIIRTSGMSGLFKGWQSNLIMRDIPFSMIKMTLFDVMCNLYRHHVLSSSHNTPLSAYESVSIGFVAGAVTGVLTSPMDVVNTRIKSGEFPASRGILRIQLDIVRMKDNGGVIALYRGVLPRIGVISIGSTAFWSFYEVYHRFSLSLFGLTVV
jgi:solute carrier family 25 (mitochondrial S-adenosylmethionine transporter), member 26